MLMPNDGYKGDITASEAYEQLMSKTNAVLIDVRTDAEWAFVGIPSIKGLVRVPWQEYPHMQVNEDFAEEVGYEGVEKTDEVFLICRSGVRSALAAAALTAAGFENCYNIIHGFEGDRDDSGKRGRLAGWKYEGLPWAQP